MARELSEINNSGELTQIHLGDTDEPAEVPKKSEVVLRPVTDIDFTPQVAAPPFLEGRVFFDDESKSLSVLSDVDGFTLNVGQEGVTRVYNATGATILNGQVCTASGHTNNFPNAVLAQADTYLGSRVLGVATHDIAIDSYGFLTNIGSLGYNDQTLVIDEMIYLSETVPGGMTNTPPDFASVIGVKLSDTRILVNINNHKTLPTAIGWIYDLTGQTYDLVADAAPTPLTTYVGSDSVFLTVDAATGELTIPYEGVYDLTITFSATFTVDAKDNRTFYMRLEDVTGGLTVAEFGFPIPSEFAVITGTIAAPVRVAAAHSVRLSIRVVGDDVSGIQFTNINFAVRSVQIK